MNIIGDIHGRNTWKELIVPNDINVFVGDYFDSYSKYTFDELKQNFLDIIMLKKSRPETILLLGNHDMHYLYGAESTRFIYEYADEIKQLFIDNLQYFHGIAYANEQVLVTHAGVSKAWLEKYNYTGNLCPIEIANWINNLYNNKDFDCFKFGPNADKWDTCGESITQSPIWIRPNVLLNNNPIPNYYQVVGHTQISNIANYNNIYFVDCLGSVSKSLFIDSKYNFEFNGYPSTKDLTVDVRQ